MPTSDGLTGGSLSTVHRMCGESSTEFAGETAQGASRQPATGPAGTETEAETMEYKCPLYESSQYTCDRQAVYLVNNTAICGYHAGKLGLRMETNDAGEIITTSTFITKVPA